MYSLAFISNLAGADGIMIFLVLLLLFGAKKLPELARGLGSAVREFSKAKDEIHHEMTRAATPQHPQIEPPRYTEPQVSSTPTGVESTSAEPAVEHVAAPHSAPSPSAQAGHVASTPVTEEHHRAEPTHIS